MNFSKKVLPNGARLISIPMPASPTVTVMILVEAGSKYETKKLNGISHFLEHFVFKGTERRPKTSDLSRELDALGAQYNAFTSQEFTGYYAKAHKDKAEKILDIVSDMYLNPTLPEAELEREKGVIIQEIHMYEDEPMKHVQDIFMELLYADQPVGWNIAG
ncbi:MAG: pitrilysin family protein, partial [Candidatus Liptonbacteria bacterium]|nr:pitrilysin family protein [Candidatus Liptonbacteria bacterium]